MKKVKSCWWLVEHEMGVDALETEEPVTEEIARKEFETRSGLKVEVIAPSTEENVMFWGIDVY